MKHIVEPTTSMSHIIELTTWHILSRPPLKKILSWQNISIVVRKICHIIKTRTLSNTGESAPPLSPFGPMFWTNVTHNTNTIMHFESSPLFRWFFQITPICISNPGVGDKISTSFQWDSITKQKIFFLTNGLEILGAMILFLLWINRSVERASLDKRLAQATRGSMGWFDSDS